MRKFIILCLFVFIAIVPCLAKDADVSGYWIMQTYWDSFDLRISTTNSWSDGSKTHPDDFVFGGAGGSAQFLFLIEQHEGGILTGISLLDPFSLVPAGGIELITGVVSGNSLALTITDTVNNFHSYNPIGWPFVENGGSALAFVGTVAEGVISGTTQFDLDLIDHFDMPPEAYEPYIVFIDSNITENGIGNFLGAISKTINRPSRDISSLNGDAKPQVGDPINSISGNMHVAAKDSIVSGNLGGFGLNRTYNSSESAYSGPLGIGWTHDYNVHLTKDSTTGMVRIKDEQGKGFIFGFQPITNKSKSISWVSIQNVHELAFNQIEGKKQDVSLSQIASKEADVAGAYVPQYGDSSTLIKTGTGFLWRKKDGTQYFFDADGRLLEKKDRNNNATVLVYDSKGNLIKIIDSVGRITALIYDAQKRITRITGPGDRKYNYIYDSAGDLISVTDPANNCISYQYDINHRITRKTDANNNSFYYSYDSQGRCISSHGENNVNYVGLSFDDANKKTTITDSKGNQTIHYYSNDYLVTKVINPQGKAVLSSWDTDLNLVSRTDELGRITRMEYDAAGNLIKTTDSAGNVSSATYELTYSQPISVTDALNNTTEYEYDTRGNIIKITDSLGNSTLNSYDSKGLLVATTNPRGATTSFTYDSYGNLASKTDPLNNITTFTNDILGNLIQSKDAKNNITNFTYDSLNRLTKITYPDASVIKYAYNAVGNKISVTDNAGNITKFTYDQNGKILTVTNPLNKTTSNAYDAEENLTSVTDPSGNVTTYQYDSLNRKISETNALGKVKSFSYDAVGNKTSFTDAKNNRTTYEYDALNRLARINYPSGTVSFTYDALGRKATMVDSQGTTSYTYDALGQLTKAVYPGTNSTINYTYDAAGNRVSMTIPGSKTTTYSYDALNRISSIKGYNNKTTNYTYDAVGNLATVKYPNNVTATYTYDTLNRLTRLVNQGATKLSDFAYTYNTSGRKSSVVTLDGTINYTYDAAGQITSEVKTGSGAYQQAFEYDSAGNRTKFVKDGITRTYTYNAANQLATEQVSNPKALTSKTINVTGTVTDTNGIKSVTVNTSSATLTGNNFSAPISLSAGLNAIIVTATDNAGNIASKTIQVTYNSGNQTIYTYDDNGNLIRRQSASEDLNLSYDYDNRLTRVIASPAQQDEAIYTYSGDGRRVAANNKGTATNYLYDGMDVVLESNVSGTPTSTYIRNPYAQGGIGGIISTQPSTYPENYYSYDGIGSVANLSNTSGALISSFSYDAFGNLLSTANSANNHQFLTKEQDSSGLIYFGARYYDPKIGRFITEDSIGIIGGMNFYAYCQNDPINLIDLWGFCPDEPGLEPAPWWLDPSDLTFIIVSGGMGSGPQGWLFGRGIGLANTNDLIRIGWSWKGTAQTGREIFRIAIGSRRLPFHWHFP